MIQVLIIRMTIKNYKTFSAIIGKGPTTFTLPFNYYDGHALQNYEHKIYINSELIVTIIQFKLPTHFTDTFVWGLQFYFVQHTR